MKSKVYFTKEITPENLIKLYEKIDKNLTGKIAVKLHSGEKGNQNFIKPEFVKPIIEKLNATVIETNTAYEGERNTTEKHEKLLLEHGWSKYFKTDILDNKEDIIFEVKNGKKLTKNYVGKNIENYNSVLVISHFKGHPMAGYGGALKQLAIGFASSKGKRYIHCVGKENQPFENMFKVKQEDFQESMADAAKTIHEYFKDNIIYINIMCNISVDCDCVSNAQDPCMKDIGVLASTDPVAIDQACIDLIYNSDDKGKEKFIERLESKKGLHLIQTANEVEIGNKEYELITI